MQLKPNLRTTKIVQLTENLNIVISIPPSLKFFVLFFFCGGEDDQFKQNV